MEPELEIDNIKFCGYLCWAARGLGYKIVKLSSGPKFRFGWADFLNAARITPCDEQDTAKNALIAACCKMQQMLAMPTKS